jgi:dTDP-4-dehydrorhamnose reductase
MAVLVLGDGILATELVRQTGWRFISRKKNKIDITQPGSYSSLIEGYDIIINCIACTDTYSTDKQKHWDVNYKAVADLVKLCNAQRSKLVHISTDYIYANSEPEASEESIPQPVSTWYGHTKMLGDAHVQLAADRYLICRESHKPYPFPYKQAWSNQHTNGDYVPVIADLIIQLINKNAQGVYNVGTEIKTWFNHTKEEFNTTPSCKPEQAPADITMNLNKLKDALKRTDQ